MLKKLGALKRLQKHTMCPWHVRVQRTPLKWNTWQCSNKWTVC